MKELEKSIETRIKRSRENEECSYYGGWAYDQYVVTMEKLLAEYDTTTITEYMCDEIREELHSSFDDFECFLVAYCEAHDKKYQQDFYYAF